MPKSSYRWIWSIWESLQCTNLWRLVRRMYQPLYQPLKTDVPTFVPTFEDWCTNLCTNLWRLRVHLIDCSYRWIWSIRLVRRMYQPLYQPLKTEGVRLVAGYLYFFLRYWICFQDPLWEFFPPLWLCVRHNGGDLGLWEQMMGKIPTDPDPSIVSDTESLWWEKFPQWILKTDPVPQKKSINSLPLAPHPSVFKSLSNIQHHPVASWQPA